MEFNPDDIRKVRLRALADKHKCSYDYVLYVLNGTRRGNSKLAQSIIKDAKAIVEIIDGTEENAAKELIPTQTTC